MCGKKEFFIDFDEQGNMEVNLRSFEQESPKIAALFEKAIGTGSPLSVKWDPKAHAKVAQKHHHHHHP